MLEESLIRDMRAGLTESIDKAIFVGDDGASGTDADVTGLTAATGVTEKTLSQANKIKPSNTLQAFDSLVDGVHASGVDDLRIVASEGSHQLWTGEILTVASETASIFKTLGQFLNDNGVHWRVRQLEAATTNGKFGAFISRQRGIDRGGGGASLERRGNDTRPVFKSKKRRMPAYLVVLLEFRPAKGGKLRKAEIRYLIVVPRLRRNGFFKISRPCDGAGTAL